MPQFDKVTFFNQIFWFLLAFLSFYFVILKGLLPVLAASLKTRKKVVNFIFSAGASSSSGSSQKSYFKNCSKFLKTYKTLSLYLAQKKISLFEKHRTEIISRSLFS